VLDPFGGSGSTLIAAERIGCNARLIDIDARYADTIVRRWQNLTGGKAVEAASGRSFKQREAERDISASRRGKCMAAATSCTSCLSALISRALDVHWRRPPCRSGTVLGRRRR